MSYLDETGLSYFWGKIKAWANSVFALLGHTHPSSDVTLMTGYSMPSSASAISSSDTLNQAVGKLEKTVTDADLSNLVHKTGTETISGTKTFTGDVHVHKDTLSNQDNIIIKNDSIDITTGPSSGITYNALACLKDVNDRYVSTIQSSYSSSGVNGTYITARNWVNDAYSSTQFTVVAGNSGSKYATLNSPLYIQHQFANVALQNTSITKGTNPSSDMYTGIYFADSAITSGYGSANRSAVLEGKVDTNGKTSLSLRAYDWTASSTANAEITIHYPKNGTPYTQTVTPADNDNTTKIATTAWVQKFCGTTKGYISSYPSLSLTTSGSGNAITALSVSGHAITATKGSTFLTSHQSLANYVTLNTEQTISAAKVFNSGITFSTGVTLGTNPSSTISKGFYLRPSSIGYFETNIYNNGGVISRIVAKNNKSSNQSHAALKIECNNDGSTVVFPDGNGSTLLGRSDYRFGQIYSSKSSIVTTSDARLKTEPENVPDKILDIWDEVNFVQYKMLESVEKDGFENARLHTGMIAQHIDNIFKKYDIDISKYGLFCYDKWEATPECKAEDGRIIDEYMPAGDCYSLKYVEVLCMEAAYMRRENARMKKRVSDLEDRLAALELRLGSE